ncbi:uncharacterized protein BO80DRAFT_444823 [Aspergillus ibericus CBS 121593]|uniref:Heterokaryon incompatibility domain-containing protein n=1 Tax=Aspergillus ibericus CBS 121593 TaxID=1448316 RepID=A0A395H0Q7_9EURO|nr:hypothetical protein BO80DRAFT_444823 [Aspergillus ibericus CBS 121593]RAL01386.1 hypothetical protein BO80DRAFT_444823 [Aspergillus ibericus CBS 121593]
MLKSTPLMTDGWYTQAWLLSPRILHWTRDGLVWQCRWGIWHDGFGEPGFKVLKLTKSYAFEDESIYGHLMDARRIVTALREEALGDLWLNVVRYYLAEQSARPFDRLAVLNGLARYLSEKHRVRYLAGIFSSCPAKPLLWKGTGICETGNYPTWSWASATGVTFDREFGIPAVQCVEHRRLPPMDRVPDFSNLPERILSLAGMSLSFTQHQVLRGSEPRVWEVRSCSSKVNYTVHLDAETDTFPELEDVVFLILKQIGFQLDWWDWKIKYKGLLLQKRKGEMDSLYERRGFVESSHVDEEGSKCLIAGRYSAEIKGIWKKPERGKERDHHVIQTLGTFQ